MVAPRSRPQVLPLSTTSACSLTRAVASPAAHSSNYLAQHLQHGMDAVMLSITAWMQRFQS